MRTFTSSKAKTPSTQIGRAQEAWLKAAGTKNLPAVAGAGTPSKSAVQKYNAAIEAWISA